jgi:hypothetical protein
LHWSGGEAAAYRADRDIAVAQHADQPIVFPDGQNAEVVLFHQLRSLLQHVVGEATWTSRVITSLMFMAISSGFPACGTGFRQLSRHPGSAFIGMHLITP